MLQAIDKIWDNVPKLDMYENKSADNSIDFIKKCKEFFPMNITHMLTDNGLEFTDRFVAKGKKVSGNHKFDKWCAKEDIDHRLTAPRTPKTNGMVERVNGNKNTCFKWWPYSVNIHGCIRKNDNI